MLELGVLGQSYYATASLKQYSLGVLSDALIETLNQYFKQDWGIPSLNRGPI